MFLQAAFLPKLSPDVAHAGKVSLVTLNIWFDNFAKKIRREAQFATFLSLSPDFICLQEVTPEYWQEIERSEELRKHYYVSSDLDGIMRCGYGVVILSKHAPSPTQPPYVLRLQSRMGRNLLIYDTFVRPDPSGPQRPITVSTVHLESLDSQPLREAQLNDIHNHLNVRKTSSLPEDRTCLVVGDFNFDDERNFKIDHRPVENLFLEHKFQDYLDVWRELRPHDKGKTFDTEKNGMIHSYHSYEVMRYDRVMFSSPLAGAASSGLPLLPRTIEMIGTEEFDRVRDQPVLLSDHFGLYAQFSVTP